MSPKRDRLIGAAALLALTVLMAGLAVLRARHHDSDTLTTALQQLTQAAQATPPARRAHLDLAQAAFAHAAGTYAVDPLALIGLSLLEPLGIHADEPAPPEPAQPLSDAQIDAYVRALLARAKSREALAFLTGAAKVRALSPGPSALLRFAARWEAVRTTTSSSSSSQPAAGGGG